MQGQVGVGLARSPPCSLSVALRVGLHQDDEPCALVTVRSGRAVFVLSAAKLSHWPDCRLP